MNILEGQVYDGCQPIGVPAMMDFVGPDVSLITALAVEQFSACHLKVSPRIGRTDRFIALPNGRQFHCADNTLLDSLPQDSRSEGLVAWLEQRWGFALASVVIVMSLLIVGYFYGLPAAAAHLAVRIPMTEEAALGEQALVWLDKSTWWLKRTSLDLDKQREIADGFRRLYSDLPFRDYYRLEFRDAPVVGANAFALPGGTIVMTDALVNAAESDEEVLAVLAHEIGHVELRHTMRSVLQDSAAAIIAATVTSDAASLGLSLAGLPAVVVQTTYSREFETEADDYAFTLLKQKGYSPAAFASLMERLEETRKENSRAFNFLSTHPVTEERVKRARAAAQQ